MMPKAVPPVFTSLEHLTGQKISGGHSRVPFHQDPSASSCGLISEMLPAEELPHLPTCTSQPPLQLSNGETPVGGKGSPKNFGLTQPGDTYSLTQENKRTLTPRLYCS